MGGEGEVDPRTTPFERRTQTSSTEMRWAIEISAQSIAISDRCLPATTRRSSFAKPLILCGLCPNTTSPCESSVFRSRGRGDREFALARESSGFGPPPCRALLVHQFSRALRGHAARDVGACRAADAWKSMLQARTRMPSVGKDVREAYEEERKQTERVWESGTRWKKPLGRTEARERPGNGQAERGSGRDLATSVREVGVEIRGRRTQERL